MPEFQINADKNYYTLSAFAQGYVEAMFFTNGDCGSENDHLLNELGTARLTFEAMESVTRDCEKFFVSTVNGRPIRPWLDSIYKSDAEYDEMQAGRDLWFTRQGHGVGYWDRKQLRQTDREALTTAAKAMGEANVEVSRGWIHHR